MNELLLTSLKVHKSSDFFLCKRDDTVRFPDKYVLGDMQGMIHH